MIEVRVDIDFKEGYDLEGVDDVCEDFVEATHWRGDNRVRFLGTPERLQEFIRAVKTVEEISHTFTY